jgi:hypothetical protein
MSLTANDVMGRRLRDKHGTVVGRVTAVVRYPTEVHATGGAAAVTAGRVMRSTHLVDLLDAVLDGDDLVVAYPAATIKTAPNHGAMIGDTLSQGHAAELLQHYRGSVPPA